MLSLWIHCCCTGRLTMLRILHKFYRLDSYDYQLSFVYACYWGQLKVAKWLLSVDSRINVSYDNDDAFRGACQYGMLTTAQWLLSIKPDINISAQDEFSFRFACANGHLNVAQWLLTVKPDINISTVDGYAFRWACYKNRLDVVQWLLSIKPNIDSFLIRSFVFQVSMCPEQIQRMFISLKPWRYQLTLCDGNKWECKVNLRREERWYFQRYPLWLMSSISPNRNSIFYKLPFDISKDIILNWL